MTPLLTPDAVAALLAISRKTVYRLARSGELPSIAVTTALRFDPEDVKTFAEKNRRVGPTPPIRKGGRRLTITTPRTRKGGAAPTE